MMMLPRTLFGRTAVLIALLMALSLVAAFCIFRALYASNLRDIFAGQIAENIVLVETELRALPPEQRAAFLGRVSVNGTRLVEDGNTAPSLDYAHERRGLQQRLQARLDQPVEVGTNTGRDEIWVGFASGGRRYWLILPYSHFTAHFPYGPLAWFSLLAVISMGGAYLIIFGLSRRLREAIQAARAIGRGERPERLPEAGPLEMRELSRGFNQMADGLHKLDAERRLMLAGISHDLRSPLARVRLGLEMVTGQRESALASNMVQDVEEIDAIITQFLDYARDGQEEEPGVGDLNQVILDVCGRYLATGAEIGTDLEQMPVFSFRHLAMRRMIANLVDNAVRYGGNKLQVLTRRLAGKVVITVMDRGPGINGIEPTTLLKPFVRGDAARGNRYGAGLGLAIADRIVQTHAGALQLSNREGGGLQVVVEIPVT